MTPWKRICHRTAQRGFAWSLHAGGRSLHRLYGHRKQTLLGGLTGTVVEIGPGAGSNLPYYPKDIRLIGVEPNPYMHPYLREEAARHGIQLDIIEGVAETLDVADRSVDAVVSTLVLCSVRDTAAALGEVRRVLKPGGQFVFVEHVVAPPRSWHRWWQNRLRAPWACVAGGCQTNRDTTGAIGEAGFHQVRFDHFTDWRMLLVAPHIAGIASTRPPAGFDSGPENSV